MPFPMRFHRKENNGPAASRNVGARLATGDVLAYTDSDCIPDPPLDRQRSPAPERRGRNGRGPDDRAAPRVGRPGPAQADLPRRRHLPDRQRHPVAEVVRDRRRFRRAVRYLSVGRSRRGRGHGLRLASPARRRDSRMGIRRARRPPDRARADRDATPHAAGDPADLPAAAALDPRAARHAHVEPILRRRGALPLRRGVGRPRGSRPSPSARRRWRSPCRGSCR